MGLPTLRSIGETAKVDVDQLLSEGKAHPFAQFTLDDLKQLINLATLTSQGVGPASQRKLGCYKHTDRKGMQLRAKAVTCCAKVHPSPPFSCIHAWPSRQSLLAAWQLVMVPHTLTTNHTHTLHAHHTHTIFHPPPPPPPPTLPALPLTLSHRPPALSLTQDGT